MEVVFTFEKVYNPGEFQEVQREVESKYSRENLHYIPRYKDQIIYNNSHYIVNDVIFAFDKLSNDSDCIYITAQRNVTTPLR